MEQKMQRITLKNDYNRPRFCKSCEGVLVYKGLGEFQCEECGTLDYDDYGKVRNYLENHRGAHAGEIAEATGVTHKAIREMIKENRFEVVENRAGYIKCEMCGKSVKSGRLCPECEVLYHRKVEAEARNERKRNKNIAGYGEVVMGEKGSKRFTREK